MSHSHSSPWDWSFEPAFAVLALLALWLWLRARRGEAAPIEGWRTACFALALVLVVASLNSPLHNASVHHLVVLHLFQNVVIGDWAPLLALLGLTPAMRERLARQGGGAFAWLVRPQIALPVWVVGWYVIHLGPVYDTAVRSEWLLHVEHAVLIALGLLFWWPVIADAPRAVSTLGRLAYVFAAFIASAFLGLALTFAPPIYEWYVDQPDRPWGLSAARDQSYGGILMSAEQAIVFGAAIVWLLVRMLREGEAEEARLAADQRAAGLREH